MTSVREDAPAAAPGRPRPGAEWAGFAKTAAVEWLPPFMAALLILPFVIQYGSFVPWNPSTIDLAVYRAAVVDMVNGKSMFDSLSPGWNLPWIYPPIAGILLSPLALGPYPVWQVLWTGLTVAAQQSVLIRAGAPRGWRLGLLGLALVCCFEPIRTTLGYGQVNTMLMWLVVADLLPGKRRFLPQGTLIGIAAAIKLTPMLFLVFAFLAGRRLVAWFGLGSFALSSLVGWLLLPVDTVRYWTDLASGKTGAPSGPIYVGNQSLTGVVARLVGEDRTSTLLGLGICGVVALLSAVVGAMLWRRGFRVLAIASVGLGTCLASPLSWTHHHVWGILLLLAVTLPNARLPRWVVWTGRIWVLWLAICLPLAVLPYGGGIERSYSAGQDLVGAFGPVLGAGFVVALAVWCLRTGPNPLTLFAAGKLPVGRP